MKTKKTLWLLMSFLVMSQTLLLAQVVAEKVCSEFQKERVKIPPKYSAVMPASFETNTVAPVLDAARKPAPARHLWGDCDCDGRLDLLVIDPCGSRLFHNRGKGDFDDVTDLAFPGAFEQVAAGSWGDYNRDGKPDLFLFHSKGFTLLRNDGGIRFTDVTEDLGLDPVLEVSAVRLNDIDGDGHEDLLVQTPRGEEIYRNLDSRSFEKIALAGMEEGSFQGGDSPGSERSVRTAGTPADRSLSVGSSPGRTAASVPPSSLTSNPASRSTQKSPSSFNETFLNDNSPGSVGIDVPEVEGGDDVTKPENDIVDGTITGSDIQNDSVAPSKITGTAATLTGSQNFDNGTLCLNASTNRVGVGTTSPDTSLHVDSSEYFGVKITHDYSPTDGYGLRSESSYYGIWGYGTATSGLSAGVYGSSSSTTGRGVIGYTHASTGETYALRGIANSTEGYGAFCESPNTGVKGLSTSTSGSNYGVHGESVSATGIGVFGDVTHSTGINYGVWGESGSTAGRGVLGYATAATGDTFGVYGFNMSETGRGVFGYSHSNTGINYGVYGQSDSESGRGVYGHATAASGLNYGVIGVSDSTLGCGVIGFASAASGVTYGTIGENSSTSGRGVFGAAYASSGTTYGVKGYSGSVEGYGVYGSSNNIGVGGQGSQYGVYGECDTSAATSAGVCGVATATSSSASGVYGESAAVTGMGVEGLSTSDYGIGVYGENTGPHGMGVKGYASDDTSGSGGIGVYGATAGRTGEGVYGVATDSSYTNYGVKGTTLSSSGYGVFSDGDYGGTGAKYFVQPHPEDASKEIRFVCLEGNESGTYFRGSSRLESGRAVIEVPEEFRLVTEPEGLTVQFTPAGPARLWFEEKNLDRIVVRGDMDVEFDYFVNGVRRGFAGFEPIRENHAWVPEYRGQPYGTQYPEALRRILVDNGTLNPDYTPNEAFAAKMGWALKDPEETIPWSDRRHKPAAIEPEDERLDSAEDDRILDRETLLPRRQKEELDKTDSSEKTEQQPDPDQKVREADMETMRSEQNEPVKQNRIQN